MLILALEHGCEWLMMFIKDFMKLGKKGNPHTRKIQLVNWGFCIFMVNDDVRRWVRVNVMFWEAFYVFIVCHCAPHDFRVNDLGVLMFIK